jgi:methylenetetrahydrofolate dehydrogenase (NADP+)/methenyltetrahydrofolate cyclohydrolase
MGCIILAKTVQQNLTGLHAVVIGRSHLVGKPVAQLLLRENCTVTVCHSRTPNIAHVAREADILVVAVGKAKLVKADWVKPGATVIDVGINRTDEGKIVGDVDYDAVSKVAGHITPVPGGVGPMTIACLLGNTVAAACRQNELTVPHIG